MTQQIRSEVKPHKENQTMAIMLYCGNCLTGRVFKIEKTLKLLQGRNSAECGIRAACEKCGHKIGVSLGWINANKRGYAYRDFPKQNREEMMVVEDKNGLRELSSS